MSEQQAATNGHAETPKKRTRRSSYFIALNTTALKTKKEAQDYLANNGLGEGARVIRGVELTPEKQVREVYAL